MASDQNDLDKLRERASIAETKLKEMEQLLNSSKLASASRNTNVSSSSGGGSSTTSSSTSTSSDEKEIEDESSTSLTVESIINRLSTPDYQFASTLLFHLGPSDSKSPWKGKECGDGNINYIFIIESSNDNKKSMVIKQAPPYIRLVGPVWPLKQLRIDFEVKYTQYLSKHCKDTRDSLESNNDSNNNRNTKRSSKKKSKNSFSKLYSNNAAPEVYFYDSSKYLFAMENLSNCVIFRTTLGKKINEVEYYPLLGSHIGYFLANILFKSSDIYLTNKERNKLMNLYTNNIEMMGITEQVIFEEPYFDAKNNRRKLITPDKTNDDNDEDNDSIILNTIRDIRNDKEVLIKIMKLRELFRCKHEALLHGDLHTGSLMVNMSRTVAIDAEFSFFGPMSFDIGQIIGNMALGLIAQDMYETIYDEDRGQFKRYIAGEIRNIWSIFEMKFIDLWNDFNRTKNTNSGDDSNNKDLGNLFPTSVMSENEDGDDVYREFQQRFMSRIFNESMGFAGSVMIRRCIGIADGPEYRVDNVLEREIAEDRALRFARKMMVDGFDSINEMTQTLLGFE